MFVDFFLIVVCEFCDDELLFYVWFCDSFCAMFKKKHR